ncbi:MAG: MaoC family dehydratase N-terminal domain-containing protein [Aestuariivita sp.]|nr:MaoC family dehydratase N-terminal domain-containing protein [Aestuariivita sp.]
MGQQSLDNWIGREIMNDGEISEYQAAQIHVTVGEGNPPRKGDAMPYLWHWCAFPTVASNDLLGADGHVHQSKLLPPVPMPRRMWAGGRLQFFKPTYVGESLKRKSKVRSISEKMGKVGPLVIVTVEHDLYSEHGLVIKEMQDIVYLEIPDRFTPPTKLEVPSKTRELIDIPETLLFRYSAITFNAHRIHYDLPYTQEIEKYPNLIVHGPMQATFLMRHAVRDFGYSVANFEFRSVHPMFVGNPCGITQQVNENVVSLWAVQDDHQCMQAKITLKDTL